MFTSLISILSSISTGKYEQAIQIPKNNIRANSLGKISIYLSFAFSSIITIFLLSLLIFGKISNDNLILLFLPFGVIISALNSVNIYKALRYNKYKEQSAYYIVFNILNASLTVIAGLITPSTSVLVTSYIVSQCISTYFLHLKIKSSVSFNVKLKYYILLIKKYINFPKYQILVQLQNNLLQQSTPLILAILFTPSIVGFYSLANRALKIPLIILSGPISGVFRNDLINTIQRNNNPQLFYFSILKTLSLISLPIFIIIYTLSPFLFTTLFGKNWTESGYIAQILTLYIYSDFISIPIINSIYIITNNQKIQLTITSITTIVTLCSFYISNQLNYNIYITLMIYSVINICSNIISFFIASNILKNKISI